MIVYYRVVWSIIGGDIHVCYTQSSIAADDLLELLSQRKAVRGDLDFCRVDAVPDDPFYYSSYNMIEQNKN